MIVEFDKVNEKTWNSSLEETGVNGTIFQSTHWADFLKKTYRDRPIYIASLDKKGNIQGLLLAMESCYAKHPSLTLNGKRGEIFGRLYKHTISPIFHILLPFFYWENGPIILPQSSPEQPFRTRSSNVIYKNILKKIIQKAQERNCYEIKFARSPYFDDRNKIFSSFDFNKLRMGTILTNLDKPIELIWKGFHKKTRYIIKKTIKKNVYIEKISKKEELKDFYILYFQMAKRAKIKIYPYSYFESLWDHFYSKNKLMTFIAKKDDIPLGTLMFLVYNKMIHIWSGGDSNYARKNKLDSNYYLMWHAINWAKFNDFKYFDLAGVELYKVFEGNEKAKSILSFKSKWGNLIEFHDYQKPLKENKIKNLLEYKMVDSVIHS